MKKYIEKISLYLYDSYGITPNMLSYSRIFIAPWLALLAINVLKNENISTLIMFLILYILAILTDLMDGVLARHLHQKKSHDIFFGGKLDRIADKIFIIFLLVPFGSNLFTILIILGESLLAYQAIGAENHHTQAKKIGKIKMVLQTILIPILLMYRATSFIPDIFLYAYTILTVIFTYISVYQHLFQNTDESEE